MSLLDLGELYPGFAADMSWLATRDAAAAGTTGCPRCPRVTLIQGGERGLRAHAAVVHPITLHPSQGTHTP